MINFVIIEWATNHPHTVPTYVSFITQSILYDIVKAGVGLHSGHDRMLLPALHTGVTWSF